MKDMKDYPHFAVLYYDDMPCISKPAYYKQLEIILEAQEDEPKQK